MKNLYQNPAKIQKKFIWKNSPSAKKVSQKLNTMKTEAAKVKNKTGGRLELLKGEAAFSKALVEAQTELKNYRQALLKKEITGSSKLSEKAVYKTITQTVRADDINSLESELGLNLTDNDGFDADNNLDLDEFSRTKNLALENLTTIIESLSNIDNPTGELKKVQEALNSSKKDLSELETKSKSGAINDNEREKLETKILDKLSLILKAKNIDLGVMMQEFAHLAMSRGNNSKSDIDSAINDFIDSYNSPPSQGKAVNTEIEKLHTQNPELAKFFAEFYPPRDFEADLKDYKNNYGGKEINSNNFKSELPQFFWVMPIFEGGQSLSETLINFEGRYEELQTKITADIQNDAQAGSFGGGIMNIFNDFWSDVNSNMPKGFRHFRFTMKDMKNPANKDMESLFKNKMSELLGKKTINFAGIKEMSRKLDWEKDAEMIEGLFKEIPSEHDGEDGYGEKYRQAVKDGNTRKKFKDWLKEDSGITRIEKVTNFFGNFLTKIAKLFSKLGIFKSWANEYLENIKNKEETESPLQEEIKTNLENKKSENEKLIHKQEWLTTKSDEPNLWKSFIKFNQDNYKIIDLGEWQKTDHQKNDNPQEAGDLPEAFGKVSPEEFKTKWNSTKSEKILNWARNDSLATSRESISIETWKSLAEMADKGELKVTTGKKLKSVKKNIPNHQQSREISGWNETEVAELQKDDPRIEKFNELKSEEPSVLAEEFEAADFFKYESEIFEDDNVENKNMKTFFAGLFSLGKESFWGEYKLTPKDLAAIIQNKDKLESGFDTKIRSTETDNDYWMSEGGQLQEVSDGKLVNDNSREIGDKTVFGVNLDGWDWGFYDNFASVEALIKKLKQ